MLHRTDYNPAFAGVLHKIQVPLVLLVNIPRQLIQIFNLIVFDPALAVGDGTSQWFVLLDALNSTFN